MFSTSFPLCHGLIVLMPFMMASVAEPAHGLGFIIVVVVGMNSASAILESDKPMIVFTNIKG